MAFKLATTAGMACLAFVSWFLWPSGPTPEQIAEGRMLFEHEWSPHDPLAQGDGLGPVFNARSCAACHFQAGVGGAGDNSHNVSTFQVLPRPFDERTYSGVIHSSAVNDGLAESFSIVRSRFPVLEQFSTLIDGCQQTFMDVDPVIAESINTPPLFGLGLLEDIPGYSIHAAGATRQFAAAGREFSNEFNSTTTVGSLRVVRGKIGRFGWKGQFATLEDFVATACAVELGLSNNLRAQDTPRQFVADQDAEEDITRRQMRSLVAFVRDLPRPEQVLPTDPDARRVALQGEELFSEIGCADCHTPDLGSVKGVYSDFRLYDLTPADGAYGAPAELTDRLPTSQPRPDEWKTPPLWGVADSAPYMHNGSATTLLDAITQHKGQARHAQNGFSRLTDQEQVAVLTFLGTLKAPRPIQDDATP